MEQTEDMISTTATPGDSTATSPSPSSSNHQTSGEGLGQDTVDDAQNDVHDSVMLNGYTSAECDRQRTGNRLDKSLPLCPSPELHVKEEEKEGPRHFVVELKSEQELEAPLDFSLKRRDATSEAYTKDSKPVSSIRSHHCLPFPSLSSRSSPDTSQDHQQSAVPRYLRHDSDSSHDDQDQGYRMDGSPDGEHGTFAGLANLSAVLGQNGAMMGSLSSIPTLLEAHKLQAANGGKVQRPFKAYPKEVLQMPLGYFGLPGVSPFPSINPSFLQGLTVLPDDVMTNYKQQADFLKEREKQAKSVSKRGSRSPPSTAVPTSSASIASNGSSQVKTPAPPSSTPARPSHPLQPSLSSTQTPSPPPDLSAEAHTASTTSLTHAHSPASLAVSQGADSTPSTSSGTHLVSSTSSVTAAGGSRKRPRTLPNSEKDDAYWERRRKNNDAAKRSRDARRTKEDEIAIRAALLEQENLMLRVEVATLKTETARLRYLLYKT